MNATTLLRLAALLAATVLGHGADLFPVVGTTWTMFRGRTEASAPATAWREVGFNDSTWENAPAPIYYSTASPEPPFFTGEPFAGTRLADMQDSYTCVFLRRTFTVASLTNIAELTLTAACDDGFIAWINGQEVARSNVPDGDLAFDQVAFDSPVEPVPLAAFAISQLDKVLVEGQNVLAIQAFNRALESSDFGFMASLASTVPLPPVADTKFDQDRGFHSASFNLGITCATPGATIYYTLDGSSPSSTHGLLYSGPIRIAATTVVRARADKAGYRPSNIDTHTYVFLNDVVRQAPDGIAPPGWPDRWGANRVDYGMDPRIVNRSPWNSQILTGLQSLPSLSLVTDPANLFDQDSGIYANPSGDGRTWERPCSLELLKPAGAPGFQENAGVRIRGGFSRSTDDPKHSLRFYFRSEYGASKLRFPLFGPSAAHSFDQFDLRTSQDGSWAYTGSRDGFFLNDPFARDTLLALGQPAERGDFVHLYINGQYWGLYNTCERPEASYAATYFGGEPEDYDVLKPDPQSGYVMAVTDGNDLAWKQLWRAATNGFASNAAYFALQGRDPDGTPNPTRENLLDVTNLVDYLLTIIWTGNYDGPIYGNLNDGFLNNYYAFRSRRNTGGFRFITHDAELSLADVNENRAGTSTRGDPARGDGPDRLNPHYLWTRLRANPEFKLLVADRIQKHFLNGGPLSTEACTARFNARKTEIDSAVIAESARWGDAQHSDDPITRDDWLEAINDKLQNYFPKRSANVLKQLRGQGLWPPTVGAPAFSQWGGETPAAFKLSLSHTNAAGSIFLTLDGSDPRSPGGMPSLQATPYSDPILIDHHTQVKARVRSGDAWSPLIEAAFSPAQDFSGLRISEIMYHPPPRAGVDGEEFEFLELKNVGTRPLDMSGLRFSEGIRFTFANGTVLSPGSFFVLARSATNFTAIYPGVAFHGVYEGKLENGGESITLQSAIGKPILSLTYGDATPWPEEADGMGYSLVPDSPTLLGNPSDPTRWRASSEEGGSPGRDDPPESSPRLRASLQNGQLVLTWPAGTNSLQLESRTGLDPTGSDWTPVPATGGANTPVQSLTNHLSEPVRFFRLRRL